MTGIIAIQNYQVIMYSNLGMTNTMSLTLTAIWGTLATFSAVMTTLYFDKLGRKPVIVSIIDNFTLTHANTCIVHLIWIPNYRLRASRFSVGALRSWKLE